MAGLEMAPGTVVTSLDAMNINLDQVINDAQKMLCEISELENTTTELVGESYDSIRAYYSSMHTAVMRAIILYAEAMIQENNTYKNCIGGYLTGIGYVNEEKLKEERELLNERIRMAYQLVYASKCSSYSSWIGSMEEVLRLIDEKLDQIDAFKAATDGLYQTIDSYENILKMGIESLNSSVFDGKIISYPVDYIDHGWKADVDKQWEEREIQIKENYIRTMEVQYGFDKETALIMLKLYDKVSEEYGELAKQKFSAIMASFCYSVAEAEEIKGMMWYLVADVESELITVDKLEKYGFTKEEIEKIKIDIETQHNSCKITSPQEVEYNSQYSGKVDYAHMMVILATINKSDLSGWKAIGNYSGIFNGTYDIEKNAGYVGDVYGTAGNGPKLTADDYKADLDAVNISNRGGSNTNLMFDITKYYNDIASGTITREKEFLINIGDGYSDIGMNILIKEANANIEYMDKYDLTPEDEAERKKVVANFIQNIMDSNNIYDEYQEVDYSKIARS